MFFANHVKGVNPKQCPDNDGHNVDAIDALTLAVPVILRYASEEQDRERLYARVNDIICATRKCSNIKVFSMALTDIMVELLNGKDLKDTIEATGQKYWKGSIKKLVASSRDDPMVACYIDSSFPALLHFAYKYADSPERAILANANAGGENVARGSLLGAIMGAAYGNEAWPQWCKEGLKDS